jgi:heat shock protein HspQ
MQTISEAKWHIGQLVRHKMFDYRGVVYDVDPVFMLSDDWYEQVARSRPPKDEPWYRVLVDGSNQETYVAQRNLEVDPLGEPIEHQQIPYYFSNFKDGQYLARRKN